MASAVVRPETRTKKYGLEEISEHYKGLNKDMLYTGHKRLAPIRQRPY